MYSNLLIIAFNISLIPDMLAELKRLFLDAEITVIKRRNKLGTKTIKALKSVLLIMQLGSILLENSHTVLLQYS
jgi:hypothetical protein